MRKFVFFKPILLTSLILIFSCSKINDAISDLTTCKCAETEYENDEVTSTYTYNIQKPYSCDSEEYTDTFIIGDTTYKTIVDCY
jgi:hypothetical protein